MGYFLAPALVQLRSEVNKLWPGRDKTSDGWIGDTSHQARKSDHNPDWSDGGIVRAIDVDEDLAAGGAPFRKAWSLVTQIIRDPRVAYVIYEGQIWENPAAFPGRGYWRAYTGASPHDHHFHVSVRRGVEWDGDASSWGIASTVSSGGGSSPDVGRIDSTPITPIKPIELEEDDMILISAPGRGQAVIGAGYYRWLKDEEEVVAARRITSKTLEGTDRDFDLWRSIAAQGTASFQGAV